MDGEGATMILVGFALLDGATRLIESACSITVSVYPDAEVNGSHGPGGEAQ